MKKLNINIKKIALSLLGVSLAIGFYSFKTDSLPPGDVFVTTDGITYTLIPQGDFNPDFCTQSPNIQCSYAITQEGIENGLTTFSTSTAGDNVTAGYITVLEPNRKGTYLPEQ